MTLVERVSEWPKQWAREGREQGMMEGIERGIERGIEQGLAHERALLRRMAASRFGADTAEHLSEVLAGIADPERLAEVGEWLVRSDTGDEFSPEWLRHGARETTATPDGSRRGRSRRVLVCLGAQRTSLIFQARAPARRPATFPG